MSRFGFDKGLQRIADGVYAYLQPDGSWGLSNAGLVANGGRSLLIDALYDLKCTEDMLAAMRDVEPAAESIDMLVNTHDNGDHWYGNQAAAAEEIISSKACAEAMALFPPTTMAEIMKGAAAMGELGAFIAECFSKFDYDGITPTYPTRTFEGELDLKVGDLDVRLIEVGPCHTTGDVIVHVPSAKTVFAADVMFVGGHQIMWAGPVGNMVKALDKILELAPDVIVPGHGPIVSVDGVQAIKDYWEYFVTEARKRHEAGMAAFDAALELARGTYADLSDPERIALNINSLYKEFSGDPEPINPVEQFGHMAALSKALAG